MSTLTFANKGLSVQRAAHVAAHVFGNFFNTVAKSYRYHRIVSELDNLDDRLLADIGLTRGEIPEVAKKLYL